MSEKLEIQKKVFLGTVPVRLIVEKFDIPLFFNVPRGSNIGIFVYSVLSEEIGESCEDLWFSLNGYPIKWQYPIGVIYDSIIKPSGQFQPITIQVNRSKFPSGPIIRCSSAAIASHYFCHSFKESTFLVEGSLSILQQNIGLHSAIERSVLSRNFEEFSDLTSKKGPYEDWKKWPIRVYDSNKNQCLNCFLSIEPGQTIKTALMERGFSEKDNVICQGISLSTELQLSEIVHQLINPDGFIYFIV